MPASIRETLGQLLLHFRKAAGLTQEELAAHSGLSARAISDLERGVKHNPCKDTLLLLADCVGWTPLERAEFEAAAQGSRTREDAHQDPINRMATPETPSKLSPVTLTTLGEILNSAPATNASPTTGGAVVLSWTAFSAWRGSKVQQLVRARIALIGVVFGIAHTQCQNSSSKG